MAYVTLTDVCKVFKGRDGGYFKALQGVNLDVNEGEFVSLVGHSGCGKSTVLNLVAGLLPVSSGVIRVKEQEVKGPGPDRMVAFQNHSLLPWLTLRQNIALAVDQVHHQKSSRERAEMVTEHLAMVKLTAAADRLPGQVSGGMKQRCGIARALSTQPKVLLLDEPFGALDALTRATLQDELVRIWEAHRITVLMVTHDVDEALLLSDKIVLMSNGPAAKVADVMTVELARPRHRLKVVDDPNYYRQRGELHYFLNKCKREKAKPARTVHSVSSTGALLPSGLEKEELVLGFVPLLDCAPFAVAEAEGLFAQHNLKVQLSREPSWRAISDGVREGRLDAAHMVAGMPLSETLGVGGRERFSVVTALTLSRGGNAITFGWELQAAGVTSRETLARYIARLQEQGKPRLTFGVVHAASMQNLLLRDWLAGAGIDASRDLTLTVIPPPQMVANLEQGNIAAYCVGEPWNVRAVKKGLGFVPVTDADIWARHPEKVLGVSEAWAAAHPRTHQALLKALLAACRLCDDVEYRAQKLPGLLADRRFVGGDPEDVAACLTGPYPSGAEEPQRIPEFVQFFTDGANLCRTNETAWLLAQMCRWGQTEAPTEWTSLVTRHYQEVPLREAAAALGIELPAQAAHAITLDGCMSFEPASPEHYLRSVLIPEQSKVAAAVLPGEEAA